MDKVSSFERLFAEKISDLENKLKDAKNELRGKDKKILELDAQLENAVHEKIWQPQVEELQISLSMKDMVIEDLQSEKKVLQSELWSLGIILQKIQLAVANMNEKDKKAYTSALEGEKDHRDDEEKKANSLEVCFLSPSEEHSEVKTNEAHRSKEMNHSVGDIPTTKGCEGNTEGKPDSVCRGHDSIAKPLQENNDSDSSIFVDKSPIIQEEITGEPSKVHPGH